MTLLSLNERGVIGLACHAVVYCGMYMLSEENQGFEKTLLYCTYTPNRVYYKS
jgi:hypothetical protein